MYLTYPALSIVWHNRVGPQTAKTHRNKILLQKRALRLMYFGNYKSHAVPYFLSSRFLPLDFLYFKSVPVLMHDISNNLSPPNIANFLFQKQAFIHIKQGHLQEVTTLLNPQDLTN